MTTRKLLPLVLISFLLAACTSVNSKTTAPSPSTSTQVVKKEEKMEKIQPVVESAEIAEDIDMIQPQYVPLIGNIWSGVKVYYGRGSKKTYGFEIVGGSERCYFGRGVKVRYPDGAEEWKDRSYLALSDLYFILEDDQAVSKMRWYEYPYCL